MAMTYPHWDTREQKREHAGRSAVEALRTSWSHYSDWWNSHPTGVDGGPTPETFLDWVQEQLLDLPVGSSEVTPDLGQHGRLKTDTLAAQPSQDCLYCGLRNVTIYVRGPYALGCSGCLCSFFSALPPTMRPWPMSFWDDMKQLFRGAR